MNGRTARWPDILALARAAEEVGFDSLWIPDHLIYQYPFGDDSQPMHGWWDCWSLVSAIAAVTTRIEIGTLVACTNFRNPTLLAKMADTIDEISDGRLILGLGAGYHDPEFRAFGYPSDHLVSRFEDALQIIVPLLRDGRVDFDGRFYSARDCELRPRGNRIDGPPVLIAGTGERMLGLTTRYADSWNFWASGRPERLRPVLDKVDEACGRNGRDPASLERTTAVMIDLPGSEATQMAPWVRQLRAEQEPPLTGSPEELADQLRRVAAEGIDHVQVWLHPATPAGIAAFAPTLALLDSPGSSPS